MKKKSSGHPARKGLSFAARVALRDFERWMPSGQLFSEPASVVADLTAVLELARRNGLDLTDPADIDEIIDVVVDDPIADDDVVDARLDALHDYLHFRLDTEPGDDAWEIAHELIEEMLAEGDGSGGVAARGADLIADALEQGLEVDPEERRRALAATRVVAAVPALLEWIGTGRPVTDTGAPRRADIEPFARLLGIHARGVAKLPPYSEAPREVIEVQSLWQLPQVAAWWQSLVLCDVLDLRATRVRAGREGWSAEETPTLEVAEKIVGTYIGHLLAQAAGDEDDPWGPARLRHVLAGVVAALHPDEELPAMPLDDLFADYADRRLVQLAHIGLVSADRQGRWVVPSALRAAVARGVVLALALGVPDLGDDDPFSGADDGVDAGTSLFDDPAVRAEMARRGIVHRPGMAAEMMTEIAPLLAAEGIDLDNLEDTTLEEMNEALARATEQRNLRLFTAVGDDRARALAVLRLTSDAVAGGDHTLAQAIAASVPSDPTAERASVAQVMGAGFGILDSWYTDPALREALRTVAIPVAGGGGAFGMPTAARLSSDAVADVIRRARGGGSFDGMNELFMRYAGKVLFESVLVAVAVSAAARAEHEGIAVAELVARELYEDGTGR